MSNSDETSDIAEKKSKNDRKFVVKQDRFAGVTVAADSSDCSLHPGRNHSTDACRTLLQKSVPERIQFQEVRVVLFMSKEGTREKHVYKPNAMQTASL
jgi:hypothetical protein